MNRIDSAIQSGVGPGRSERTSASAAKADVSARAQVGGKSESAELPAKTEAQQAAAKMLDVIADSVMQRQVHNINVLTASVTKFMLTSLEPAMQIAQEIRAQATQEPEAASAAATSATGHEATLAVLGE